MSSTDEFGRKFYFCEGLDDGGNSDEEDHSEKRTECDRDSANLISSDCGQGVHAPVLDIDFRCRLFPSSTDGCFHLYIDKPMAWDTYEKLLLAMQEAGILQPGFVKNSIARKATFVRPPWVKKPAKEGA
jgi:hypothetical protein